MSDLTIRYSKATIVRTNEETAIHAITIDDVTMTTAHHDVRTTTALDDARGLENDIEMTTE